ncbi:MAG: C13 family peptidase [Gaiellaceae bacterium]
MNEHGFPVPARKVLESVRSEAFAMLTPRTAASTHLGLIHRVYPKGHVLRLVDREIRVPAESIIVFEDQLPGANFGHPCRYLFHSPEDGRLLHVEEAFFPPDVAEPHTAIDEFHAPLKPAVASPLVYDAIKWAKLPHYPWLVDDNRFALLFTSQISNRRHVEDVELAYRVLRHRFGFPTENIYVLCYDGTIGATDATAADMATWIGDGTSYEMDVTSSATKANLQTTLTTISGRMNGDSLLFVHTNNHGSTTGLCVDNSAVLTPSEWSTMLDGMDAFGTLVVTMEQCYSGAFLQPTLDHSKAARTSFASAVPADKVSWGATHFDPWAQAWFEGVNGATAYGANLGHQPDTNGNGRVSASEAFAYSDSYDTASGDDPQYGDSPTGCGASIYLTKPPSLIDLIKAILAKYVAIEKTIVKHPIPDPPPEWASELLASLSTAETLAGRLERAARQAGHTSEREKAAA